MSTHRFVADASKAAWLEALTGAFRVVAPRKEGNAVLFRPWSREEGVPALDRATVSAKSVILPPSEVLLRFSAVKDPDQPANLSLTLDDGLGVPAEPTVLLGARSCDTRGFLALDHAYLHGRFRDPYYAARREATLIITRSCDAPCATCFCNWVGGGPASAEGSDVQLTVLEDGWLLTAVSDKGAAFLADSSLPDGKEHAKKAKAQHQAAEAAMPAAPDISAAPARLKERFGDLEFWTAQTAKCLSCGACTYMCPTCQCFTITDEGDSLEGKRIRSWDNCMSSLFTREASGHNPRQARALRMRNRISHKYWYTQDYCGKFSCTGCGRCVLRCPASLDIREVVLKAVDE